MDDDIYFQQDNAPCHKTGAIMQLFEDEGVAKKPDWSANLQDLIIIELLRRFLKDKEKQTRIL